MSNTKGKKFAELVRRIGALDVSVLASAHPYPAPSAEARVVARQMVGAVEVSGNDRLERVAGLLDHLREADAEATSAETSEDEAPPRRRRAPSAPRA